MYRKAKGPRLHGPGRIIGFDHKVLWTLHQGTPVAVAAGRARPANVSEILAHMVLGDRISERTIDQFRAAGQQQGFVDISGRRRMRSEVDAGEQDEELEQPLVRARTAPAASSESPQLEQRTSVAGVEVRRSTSAEGEGRVPAARGRTCNTVGRLMDAQKPGWSTRSRNSTCRTFEGQARISCSILRGRPREIKESNT